MSCGSCQLIGLALLAICIIVFSLSTKARYYGKVSLFIIGAGIFPALPIPLMLFKPKDYRNGWLPAYLTVFLGWMLGVTYEFRGLENIDTKKGGVTILNHQSGLDLILTGKIFPHLGRATFVVKKEIFYLCPPIGLASWLWGTLFINRSDRKSAHALINKQVKEITDNQSKLVLFPEGTRNETETLLPFKKGPFHVAIASQTGVQPIVVSKYYYFDSKKLIFGRGHSVIKILPEISTKGMTKDDIDGLIDTAQNLMQEEYTKLSKEVYASMHNEG